MVSEATVSRALGFRWQQVLALSGVAGVFLCLLVWEVFWPQPSDFTMSQCR
jgi:hypothetical protein